MRIIIAIFSFIAIFYCCKSDCVRPDRCKLTPQVDPCYAAIPRYYYDQEEQKCKEFSWGGCAEFPFETLEDCMVCECND